MKQNHFRNFGKRAQEEHHCEILLKLGNWPRKRCHLKIFVSILALAAILFSGADLFGQFWLRVMSETCLKVW